jgi:hypothetical protein
VSYRSCLSVGAGEFELYLSVFPSFRIGRPPLLIPWTEISVSEGESGLMFKTRELRLGCEESVPLRIGKSLAGRLQHAAGQAWPIETIAV